MPALGGAIVEDEGGSPGTNPALLRCRSPVHATASRFTASFHPDDRTCMHAALVDLAVGAADRPAPS
jgi:hypothetical protein